MICDNCALKIFNPKHYNLQGIGNPFYGNLIVIPNVDYNAYKHNDITYSSQVKLLYDTFSTGELQELVFIVPLIRCNELVTTKIDDNSFKICLTHLFNDIQKYNIKRILLLGDSSAKLLNITIKDNLNNAFLSSDNKLYFVNYSPLVYYKSDEKFNIFKEYMNRWINMIKEKDYSNYNIIR